MNKPVFVGLPTCSTCKKLYKLVDGMAYRNIRENPLTVDELREIAGAVGIESLYNTSGQAYRSQNIKEKRQSLSFDEQLKLLASDGMLVKRPILVLEDRIVVGNKPALYPQG